MFAFVNTNVFLGGTPSFIPFSNAMHKNHAWRKLSMSRRRGTGSSFFLAAYTIVRLYVSTNASKVLCVAAWSVNSSNNAREKPTCSS